MRAPTTGVQEWLAGSVLGCVTPSLATGLLGGVAAPATAMAGSSSPAPPPPQQQQEPQPLQLVAARMQDTTEARASEPAAAAAAAAGQALHQDSPLVHKRTLRNIGAYKLPNQSNRLALLFGPSTSGLSLSFGLEVRGGDAACWPVLCRWQAFTCSKGLRRAGGEE